MLIILTRETVKDTTADVVVQNALHEANKHFGGNLRFNRFDFAGKSGLRLNVTLTINDVNAIGARRNDTRKVHAACWHAHGVLSDSLPVGTEIRSRQTVMHARDKWHDYNIGSRAFPLMASRACNCMEWNTGGVLPFPVNV